MLSSQLRYLSFQKKALIREFKISARLVFNFSIILLCVKKLGRPVFVVQGALCIHPPATYIIQFDKIFHGYNGSKSAPLVKL